MADFTLGMNAKIYQGAAGANISTLLEMTNVRDVTLSLTAGEADVTTRANSGWRATAPSLREASVEFEMVWKTADVGFSAIQGAFIGGTTIELAILDRDKGATNPKPEGLQGAFSVTAFSRQEPLEEAITVSVTCKLETYTTWIEA